MMWRCAAVLASVAIWSLTACKDSAQSAAAGENRFDESPEDVRLAREALDKSHSLRCAFPAGSYVNLADQQLLRKEDRTSDMTFDAIDRQHGRARVVTTNGASDVTVIAGGSALTFIDISVSGNPMVTVVFPRFKNGRREFFAADSEHAYAFGKITVGQYFGSCRSLE